ncbi:alpha/beta fold hydrolase [Candidatus Woesearchaeota archaeon]|nr:alpha/beta fold hydrolase [Candidatus Woesearchaeota archaeon]
MQKQTKRWIIAFIIILVLIAILESEYAITKIKSKIIAKNVENFVGKAPSGKYPLLLLHGFNPTYSKRVAEFSFKNMQDAIAYDLNYSDKGILIPETTCAQLQYSENPIVLRASYYSLENSLEIEQYAKSIKKMIDKIKYCTGAEKVDIVTHSMGGIITRYYIQNYDNASIRKFIMLTPPNHGKLYNIGKISDYLIDEGESRFAIDFIQLSENHNLMKQLNKDETIPGIDYYTIAGKIDEKGDSLVLLESVPLQGAKENKIVKCNHFLINNPAICKEAYELLKEMLK